MKDTSYIDRLVKEKEELDEKRSRLVAFLNGGFPKDLSYKELGRLRKQNQIMFEYSNILEERIEYAFKQKEYEELKTRLER